jgi:hypothetical protein
MSAVAKGPPVPAPFFPQHTAPVVIADPRYSPAARGIRPARVGDGDRAEGDSPELAAVRAMAGQATEAE